MTSANIDHAAELAEAREAQRISRRALVEAVERRREAREVAASLRDAIAERLAVRS